MQIFFICRSEALECRRTQRSPCYRGGLKNRNAVPSRQYSHRGVVRLWEHSCLRAPHCSQSDTGMGCPCAGGPGHRHAAPRAAQPPLRCGAARLPAPSALLAKPARAFASPHSRAPLSSILLPCMHCGYHCVPNRPAAAAPDCLRPPLRRRRPRRRVQPARRGARQRDRGHERAQRPSGPRPSGAPSQPRARPAVRARHLFFDYTPSV